tara:strand:- start:4597 stop:5505 length:909 start_codon:yes stop_codon:yes gene_type:complete
MEDYMSRNSDGPSDTGVDGFFTFEGLRFHYVTWGDPSLPLLICLHGLRSYARTFEPFALRLADRFHVLSLDQRGRGDTDWDPAKNYFADQYVRDLEALVAELGCRRFHLLGHSMGGANALLYASRNSERLASIILEESGPGSSVGGSAGVERIKAELHSTPMAFSSWEDAAAFWRSVRPNVTEAAISSRVKNSLRRTGDRIVWKHDQAGIAECRISPDAGRGTPDLWPGVDAVRCPALILRGENSDYLSKETATAVCRRNSNFQMHEIAGAGHYVHDDNPDEFMRIAEAFLVDAQGRPSAAR